MNAVMAKIRREPLVRNGDRMSQEDFHRANERMADDVKAELIEGVVYMASPVGLEHGRIQVHTGTVLTLYAGSTPGVEVTDNATVILSTEDEPQPDLSLRILPEFGGQTRTQGIYLAGAPEFIVEVAYSSRAVDLYGKRRAYARYRGIEYLVADLEGDRLHWFDLRADQELAADSEGVCHIRAFPGLWIDGPALFAYDVARLTATLNAGLASPEHATFVAALAARRSGA